MLKKIMLPVVLFFMLMRTCVVVKADDVNHLDAVSGMSHEEIYNYMIDYVSDNGYSSQVSSYQYSAFWDYTSWGLTTDYYVVLTANPITQASSDANFYSSGKTLQFTIHSDGTITIGDSSGNLYRDADCLFYLNYDICDSSGNVMVSAIPFPIPPLGMEEETLAAMIHPEIVLQEVIAILPMILACLVGYLALRKALAALREILYQA